MYSSTPSLAHHADEHGDIAADFRVAAEETIELVEDLLPGRRPWTGRQRALQHGGDQRRAQALAADVGNENCGAIFG